METSTKGINSRWRVSENDQLFEVQFYTSASFEAKYDEQFGHDLEWTKTPLLYSFERGNLDNQLYEISTGEADRIVERIRCSVTGQPT